MIWIKFALLELDLPTLNQALLIPNVFGYLGEFILPPPFVGDVTCLLELLNSPGIEREQKDQLIETDRLLQNLLGAVAPPRLCYSGPEFAAWLRYG